MTDNYMAVANAHTLSKAELCQFTINAIDASFITAQEKERLRGIALSFLGQ
ncbi:hypothetical protein [Aestuariirhabdus sp. LZHN29]|uniref:hypothetical protein n=1 Tax=Aestuariirhabdus sp. LZHN29 TaxID=3417462 RepID=UPI003CEEFCEA